MPAAITFRRTTILTCILITFLAGVAVSRRQDLVPKGGLVVSISCLLAALLKRKNSTAFMAGMIFAYVIGCWRGAGFYSQIKIYESLYGQQVTVQVVAKTDGVYNEKRSLSLDAGDVHFTQPMTRKLPGIIKLEPLGVPSIIRGDVLIASGRLYRVAGARQGSIKFAKAQLVSRHLNVIEKFRLRFNSGTQTALPEPHASFGLGILVGQRSTLPPEVTDNLSIIGLTHIIAVSGYNLTIIIRFVTKKLGKRSKYQTLLLSILLICLFVLITGFSASIVRAALVSGLSLGAWYYGRAFKPLLILILPAAITVAWNPIYLWSDISWYLSFLAFYGVLILGPFITKVMFKTRQPPFIAELIIESGSAQIMTVPLVAYIFQQTSLIALPSNMLIVPLIPLAMLLSFIAGLGGVLVPVMSGWLAWPAKILLGYILELSGLLAKIPYASTKLEISAWVMIVSYALLVAASWLLWRKVRRRYDKITDEISQFEGA